MKKTVLLLMALTYLLSAESFKTEDKTAQAIKAEKTKFCKFFTEKALSYGKNMRDDELAKMTLQSYKKRAAIYCSKEEKKVEKVEKKVVEKVKVEKNIALEDERLCKIFQTKMESYKKTMRDDELAYTTLESYKQRAYIFCSEDSLEKKEKGVLKEDKKLCEVFNQGPVLCKKFDEKSQTDSNDTLSKETLKSFKKRADVFCSKKPLKEKDAKVYTEHMRLCQVFNDKIIAYKKNMRDDKLAKATLESYKKRANYFCSEAKEEAEKK